jgi:ATP-binding cassette subfamily B protein
MTHRIRLIVPEAVQTSNMDCGPAALKSLLEGFGIPANYGRLREACQTSVDGTSIDTMEAVANQLGLRAEQIMLPAGNILIDEARALPAIAVVVLPNGVTHFVVVWRRFGRFVELMDPAVGRRWITGQRLVSELYIHRQTVPVEDWRDYAGSPDFLVPLRHRLNLLSIDGEQRIASAASAASWLPLATLDAAVRMIDSLVDSHALDTGPESARVLDEFLGNPDSIPEHFWSVRPDGDGLAMRGAVLVRVTGLATRPTASSPELLAALQQPSARPGIELLRLLRADGIFTPAAIALALMVASAAVTFEAVLFRGLIGAARSLFIATLAFSAVLLVLEMPLASALLSLGRRLEIRLRLAFLEKLPRLDDRYFQSRPKSDMAERSHSIHLIRRLPDLGGQLLRYAFEIVFTAAGIIWIDPASAPIALLAATAALVIPLASQPVLMERDLRLRTHSGALTHFYLDALLGLIAIHAHGGQPAVRREHESLLTEWARAGLNLQRAVVSLEMLQFLAGFGFAIWLLASNLARGDAGAALLLVYWALNLPALGQEIAIIAWQYPSYRNVTLRSLEPLGALQRRTSDYSLHGAAPSTPGDAPVSITFENVSVVAAGHPVLRDISLSIPAGSHVAIVGASGAGKSSLVGLALGWYRAESGSVLIDGAAVDDTVLDRLRPHIAWVDPAVQLWNRSLTDNLRYGLADEPTIAMETAIEFAELNRVVDQLPNGLRTPLGEGGGLVSGGEGQRVRFARALLRPGVHLAILDEPFRGLDFEQRRTLMARAREVWGNATLLAISHDISEALEFPRVLVLEEGRIVEDSDPRELARDPESRFSAMVEAERAVRQELWNGTAWRHLHLQNGRLTS